MMRRRGFTLLEVLMAFGASSILLAVVYFFFFGMQKTSTGSLEKFDINATTNVALNSIMSDLRNAYTFSEFRPHHIVMQRLPGQPISSDEIAAIGNLHLHAVEYEIIQEKDGHARLYRREPALLTNDANRAIIEVDEANLNMFTGYVYDRPTDKEDSIPKFHIFDTVAQPSVDLPRITMVKLRMEFRVGKTRSALVSKVFLPIAHNNTVQGDWTVE